MKQVRGKKHHRKRHHTDNYMQTGAFDRQVAIIIECIPCAVGITSGTRECHGNECYWRSRWVKRAALSLQDFALYFSNSFYFL